MKNQRPHTGCRCLDTTFIAGSDSCDNQVERVFPDVFYVRKSDFGI